MWKSAYVGVYQLLNWKMHGETLKKSYYIIAKHNGMDSIKKKVKKLSHS